MSTEAGAAEEALPAVLRGYRYKPRAVAPLGVRRIGRWRVKGTAITVRGGPQHFAEIMDAAWETAAALLAAVPEGGRDAGIAHLLVHVGMGGVWLLLDWWAEGDILMHRHFRASLDDPTRFVDIAAAHYGPCVWELAVQSHERQAWLTHVLARPDGPDLAAYLADGLSATL